MLHKLHLTQDSSAFCPALSHQPSARTDLRREPWDAAKDESLQFLRNTDQMIDKKSSDNSSTMLNEEALATMDYQRAESAQTNEVAAISKLSGGGPSALGEESAATSVRD